MDTNHIVEPLCGKSIEELMITALKDNTRHVKRAGVKGVVMTKTRRLRSNLIKFFETKPLTEKEKSFIMSALRNQEKYPQLHPNIWKVVCEIEKRYKNV